MHQHVSKLYIWSMACILVSSFSFGQTKLTGKIIDAITTEAIPDVTIALENSIFTTATDPLGFFELEGDLPEGRQIVLVSKFGFLAQRLPVNLQKDKILIIPAIPLETDFAQDRLDLGIINLADSDLNDEEERGDFNISGLLAASNDVFLNAAAFDFSATFFRPRGLDSEYGRVLINGIPLNKLQDGQPQWSDWGGLNDLQRNREFSRSTMNSDYTFGGPAGTTNMTMRASQYQRGGRINLTSASRTYQGRASATYTSGIDGKGWAYSLSVARRFGKEGYVEGTPYDANSFFIAVEKKLNEDHSLNFTGIYTTNTRGRGSALTQEVIDLKGFKYNPSWGDQNGEVRNSRLRKVDEPILMGNHYWKISDRTRLNTNVAYQFGEIANGRIDNGGTRLVVGNDGQESFLGGARNPAPNYYQNLPSYFLRSTNPSAANFQEAYTAEQAFLDGGQLDWDALYLGNQNSVRNGGNNIYAVQEDVVKDNTLFANTLLNHMFNDNIKLQAGLNYRTLRSQNFARVADLLGGSGFLDIDSFAQDDVTIEGNKAQSNLQTRNRIAGKGDRYKYDYELHASVLDGFAQAVFNLKNIDGYATVKLGQTDYQRDGKFENGYFPSARSFGESQNLNFLTYGAKAGMTYKFNGRHLLDLNGSYQAEAPNLQNSFINARQNNDIVPDLDNPVTTSIDASYIFRSPYFKARVTGYYVGFDKGTDVSIFFTQSIQGVGTGSAFVQEVLTDSSRRNLGMEFGLEGQVTTTLKLKAAGAFGQNIFTNNPDLYYTSDDLPGEVRFGDGTTRIKNLHVSGGPEQAYQLGFEYRDPEYWWVGATANYFSHAFLGTSNLRRSAAFVADGDGQPLNVIDRARAKKLLQQEQLDDYMLVNLVGGKSWRIDDYYIGLFASVSNVLDKKYKTGGFEDSRISDYQRLVEEDDRERPLFGNRYFLGIGSNYYVNLYFRF